MAEDSLNFILGKDGKFHKLDNTYDVVIHCENESDQEKLKKEIDTKIMNIDFLREKK